VVLAWRLKLRGLNTVQIGERLNVSNQTAGGYIREAKELLRIDPAKVDIPTVVGESLNIYDHVSEMASRIAAEHTDAEVRLKAMAIVLKTQSDRNHFLVKVGVLAPEVSEYFSQIVLQQNIIAGKKQDPIENFMHSLATRLLDAANPKGTEPAAIEGELH
jgi:DNA-binding transcriptional regulator LsrR (DeoR family)